jgi:SAM-dependent methyltransferase
MTDRPIANVDMAAAWDGEEGASWAAQAERYDAAGAGYNRRLLEHILPSDDVLDIGCGNGGTSRAAARAARSVLGIDLSSQMLAYAQKKAAAEGLTNITYVQADAQVHPFDAASFDIAISRMGAMFFADPVAAFSNIGRALRPDGRLALVAWQSLQNNEWISSMRSALSMGRDLPEPPVGMPGPFGLADPDVDRRILSDAGYEDIAVEDVAEPITWGRDVDDAYEFVSDVGPVRGLLADLDDAQKAEALAALREMLAGHATPDGVCFGSRAWLITAHRAS